MLPLPPGSYPRLPGGGTRRVEEHVFQHKVQSAYGPAVAKADEEDVPVRDAFNLEKTLVEAFSVIVKTLPKVRCEL